MRVLGRRPRRTSDIPTSSLADMAFLLLIFFLVTTVFDEEKGLNLVLPPADRIVDVPAENVLHLSVLSNGEVEVRRGASRLVQRVQPSAVGDIWRSEVGRAPGLIAAVRTAPEARYGAMIDVLDQLQTAGAERVHLGLLADGGR